MTLSPVITKKQYYTGVTSPELTYRQPPLKQNILGRQNINKSHDFNTQQRKFLKQMVYNPAQAPLFNTPLNKPVSKNSKRYNLQNQAIDIPLNQTFESIFKNTTEIDEHRNGGIREKRTLTSHIDFRQKPHQSMTSNRMIRRINHKIPNTATSSFRAQKILPPIPYPDSRLLKFQPESIEKFELKKQDIQSTYKQHRFNHVAQNKKMASISDQTVHLQNLYRQSIYNKSNPFNLKVIKLNQEIKNEIRMNQMLTKRERWQNFRNQRQIVIEKYILQKRKQMIVEKIIRIYYRHKMVVRQLENVKNKKHYKEVFNQTIWLIFKLQMMWRRKMRVRRCNAQSLHHKKNQFMFLFCGLIKYKHTYEKSLNILKDFIPRNIGIWPLVSAVKETYKSLNQIQKRIKKQLIIRHSKVEVLINFWELLELTFTNRANQLQDTSFLAVLKKINQIPKFIQKWILTLYVYKCRELYQIAFFQWRKRYPSQIKHNPEEIQSMIEFRMKYTFDNSQSQLYKEPKLSTRTNSQIDKNIDFYRKYDILDTQNKSFRINAFSQIGWPDPYPTEQIFKSDIKCPESSEDLVYSKSRFTQKGSPSVVYIPRPEMMLKIMRACIDVQEPGDFWINLDGTAEPSNGF